MIKPKKSVEEMTGYFVPMFEKEWEYKIDSNENNYGPSPKVINALKNIDYKNISFYPFYGELTEKIAEYSRCNSDNIKVTNGADEAIGAIIQTYMEKDENLLTLDVSFDMPVIYTQISSGNVIKVPFKKRWVFPIEDFLQVIKSNVIKIIYLASPNNPTGSTIEKSDIVKIIEAAPNSAVIIDETYANYCGISNLELINNYDNVFVVKSFSKDFALAGLRLGYIISNKENINSLKKTVSPFSVNSFALKAGITALDDVEYFNNIKIETERSKSELKEFFESLGAKVYDSCANFLLIDFGNKSEYVYKKLLQNNISVKLFKKGHILENHLRVTIPTRLGVEKIKESLKIKPNLVFDMDGVLVNACNSYRLTIQKTYEKYTGKTITPKEIQQVKNMGGMNNDWDLTMFLLEKEGVKISYNELVNTFQNIYWNDGKGLINNEEPLFDRSFFEELSKEYNISVFTGRLRQEAIFALKRFNVVELFNPIITTDDIPPDCEKPNPYGLLYTKELTLGNDYYYFGDTIDDIKAAIGAGYYPVGVLPPQDKSDELVNKLKETGAKDVISSVSQIKNLMEKVNERVH